MNEKNILDKDFERYAKHYGLKIFIKDDENDSFSMEGYFKDNTGFLNVRNNSDSTPYYSKHITMETLMLVVYTSDVKHTRRLDIDDKLEIIDFYNNVRPYEENWVEDKPSRFKIEKGLQDISFDQEDKVSFVLNNVAMFVIVAYILACVAYRKHNKV